jgi:glycosyltransferase involved in cell wall biosynthesis
MLKSLSDHNPRPLNGYPLKKKIEKKVKDFFFSRYIDQFIGVSDYTVKRKYYFGFHVKPKTKTIYNGVFIEQLKRRKERYKTKFFVASHLRESKIQDLIKAVSLPLQIWLKLR